ncbi:MAG: aminotransferase class V-fold PLP-dependent enzyme [Lachnospiraceae bacterium]|nr:aminotransferase class V-fold PLP-dependent enzyme [Lachnospiraceae bacterium]MDY4971093.1 aminotransferase class V-fold PLP-dependent enzyme [Lachnospiraceae bacterium]
MPELYERLKAYAASDFYPWHMPGHKRRLVEFGNPFSMDITEIEGFDDLHHPEGILKEAMEEAAEVYGSEATYFLVNGSSCGILAAVSAAVPAGGKLLMARNCHKSAYHAALLGQHQVSYIYPELEKDGFYGAVRASDVEAALEKDPGIRAVMMVSPGYEGVVSDIRSIAEAAHAHGCALLVDEAHGAHLPFGKDCGILFPASALEQGADVVIQSLHKTLPSLTQTALLHLGKGSGMWIDRERIELYLRIYQSSSPSYIFMASIDHCIRLMAGEPGKLLMKEYAANLKAVRGRLKEQLQVLRLYEPEPESEQTPEPEKLPGSEQRKCFYDPSKFVIISDAETADGSRLAELLRKKYHLEPEMNTDRYVILMSSPADTKEGFERMAEALVGIDCMLRAETGSGHAADKSGSNTRPSVWGILPDRAPEAAMSPAEAGALQGSPVPLSLAAGRICHDFIYIYPPGIPLLVPGERIEERHLDLIRVWQDHGLEVHGIRQLSGQGTDKWTILCI